MKKKKDKEINDFIKIEQEIEERKKLPQIEKEKIKKKIKTNVIFFIVILIYLVTIYIMESNFQTETYIMILKIFSLILCLASIIMIEISYKKNLNSLILISAELLVITFFTIFLISAYSLYYGRFYIVIVTAIIIVFIYYLIKSILYYKKIKKNYYKSLNDIKTIVAK